MGLSDYMKENTYEMLTNESYKNSKLAHADMQKKEAKKQSGVLNQAAQGFSNGMQSRIYGNQMIADSPDLDVTDRPLPSSLGTIEQESGNDLQLGE